MEWAVRTIKYKSSTGFPPKGGIMPLLAEKTLADLLLTREPREVCEFKPLTD